MTRVLSEERELTGQRVIAGNRGSWKGNGWCRPAPQNQLANEYRKGYARTSPSLASKGGAQSLWAVGHASGTRIAELGQVARGVNGMRCVAFLRSKGMGTTGNAHCCRSM